MTSPIAHPEVIGARSVLTAKQENRVFCQGHSPAFGMHSGRKLTVTDVVGISKRHTATRMRECSPLTRAQGRHRVVKFALP